MATLRQNIYGPQYCCHCDKVQTVQTFELDGSSGLKTKWNGDNCEVTWSFIGTQVCMTCLKNIASKDTP